MHVIHCGYVTYISCISRFYFHLIRFRRQRKDQHIVHQKYTLDNERGNTSLLCDREDGIERTDEIEIETFSIEAEQLQDTVEEEDDYYFHDPTTIGKLTKINLHSDIQNVRHNKFPMPCTTCSAWV